MNILAFVKPKNEVVFIYDDETIQDALQRLENHRFTSIPILNREGNYVGTLTEGDLLWHMKNEYHFNVKKAEKMPVSSIHRVRDYVSVNIDAKMDELIIKATTENFVPIVDGHNLFIGIVTRKNIIDYFFEHNFIVL